MHAPLRALLCALPLLAYAASSTTPAFAYDDAGYLAIRRPDAAAARSAVERGSRAVLAGPGGGVDALVNAMCLLTHSVAAQPGTPGRRATTTARGSIAKALVSAPGVHRAPGAASRSRARRPHAPGWSSSMSSATAGQHVMFDAQIVDGLVHAWRARKALGLSGRLAAADRRPHPPRRALALLALAVDPAQPDQLVRADLRRRRDGHRRPDAAAPRPARAAPPASCSAAGNFGAGLRFQYYPRGGRGRPLNLDSAEYSNIVLSFLRFYGQAGAPGWRRCRAPAAGSSAAGSGARWPATGPTAAT